METKRNKWLVSAWYLAVFAFLYIWFSRIHPLVVYDADDWTYLAYVREAMPLLGDWNPGKVFPEVVMPLVSSIGLYTLYPLLDDYIGTFTVIHALVVSGFITLYIWCLEALLRRSFTLSRSQSVMLSGLFLLFHFMVLRGQEIHNLYLFHCVDLNCYYNYLIPALMSAGLLMFLMNNEKFTAFMDSDRYFMQGLFWVAVYFTIFSNLATSGILASFAGSRLLLELIRRWKGLRIREFIRENRLDLLILLIWFASALIELSGGRADSAALNASLFARLRLTAFYLKEALYYSNRIFWLVVGVIVVLSAGCYIRSRGKGEDAQALRSAALTVLVAAAAMLVYTLLLCAVVTPKYLTRSEYLLGLFFYGFLIVLLGAAYLLKYLPKLTRVLPLLLIVLTSTVNTNGQTFLESNKYNVDPAVCADISRDILDQVVTASEAGQKEMTLYVPYNVADPVNQDNWPHTLVLMHRISGALYEHSIIKEPIAITEAIPSVEMNERFGLAIPEE